MPRHPVLDEIDASLEALVPGTSIEFRGNWLPATRRTYQAASQRGSGSGPFVEVVDLRWRGTLKSAEPIVAVAFLVAATELSWAKSGPPTSSLDVEISLHAYADYSDKRATFASSLGGAFLPGVPVAVPGELRAVCTLGQAAVTTAVVQLLAQTEEVAFLALLLPARFIKVGRKRLWHLREEFASSLPPRVADLLTRRRSGSMTWP